MLAGAAAVALLPAAAEGQRAAFELREYPVPAGSRPHDVAPARDGGVWYTAQGSGEIGWLDVKTGRVRHVPLGEGSAPHGVIVGPDGAPWITDSGLNAIVRVDPVTRGVRRFPLPANSGYANLNTATFDARGVLWFTGQSGVYGRLDPKVGRVRVFEAPRGAGPYGITTAPSGAVYYASLAGSYAIYVDERDAVWLSDFGANAIVRFDPATERFATVALPSGGANVRQLLGRPGEVWGAESGVDKLVVVRSRP